MKILHVGCPRGGGGVMDTPQFHLTSKFTAKDTEYQTWTCLRCLAEIRVLVPNQP